MKFFLTYKYYLGGLLLLIIIISNFLFIKTQQKPVTNPDINSNIATKTISKQKCFVDIKGAVIKPGVYEVECSNIINDVIALSGGLGKDAITTNINLSKKITNEMVIIINTKKEIKSNIIYLTKECQTINYNINSCLGSNVIENPNNTNPIESPAAEEPATEKPVVEEPNSPTIISLNTATKDQLMTLSGIGEAKATSIIEYRTTNGSFKNIEEIMNVSGIGEAIFAKIKTFITI